MSRRDERMNRDRAGKTNWVYLPSKLGVLEIPVGSLPATTGTVQRYSLRLPANGNDSSPLPSRPIHNRHQNRKGRNSSSGNG